MRRALPLLLLLCLGCPPGSDETIDVFIPPGLPTAAIADTLRARGVIDNPLKFRVLARTFGFDKRLRYGRYAFRPNAAELHVLRALSEPGQTAVRVTIPEGYRLTRIAALLEDSGICPQDQFLAVCRERALLSELGIPRASAEGYLFPDTYELEIDTDPATVLRRLVRRFFGVYDDLRRELPKPPLDDVETVVLASIVEKEAVREDEVGIIAGVFLNRMKRRMPLQSCATVQYVLPEHKECLTYADTRVPSPYNTYMHAGLPPGPISNPGRRALRAALSPAQTDYLFFVAKGDGGHVFSRTWREHEKAKRRINRGA